MRTRIALLQIACGSKDKAANFRAAEEALKTAVEEHKASLCVLPEIWNSPYGTASFGQFAEAVPDGESSRAMSSWAKRFGITLVGGSIPERDEQGRLFNTSLTFGRNGELLAKHRKVHLFDIDVPGGIRFKESETLSPGDTLVTRFVVPEIGNVGLGICYDIRFPELAMLATARGAASLLVYPAAFNMTTGPLHWHLLARARAIDNQVFVAMCSPARDTSPGGYVAYGRPSLVSRRSFSKIFLQAIRWWWTRGARWWQSWTRRRVCWCATWICRALPCETRFQC
jgi:omega-amidase